MALMPIDQKRILERRRKQQALQEAMQSLKQEPPAIPEPDAVNREPETPKRGRRKAHAQHPAPI